MWLMLTAGVSGVAEYDLTAVCYLSWKWICYATHRGLSPEIALLPCRSPTPAVPSLSALPYVVTLTFNIEQCNGPADRPVPILCGNLTFCHLCEEPVPATARCRAYPECILAQRSLCKRDIHDCWLQQPKHLILC